MAVECSSRPTAWRYPLRLAVLMVSLAGSGAALGQHQFAAEDGYPSLLVLGFAHADFAELSDHDDAIDKHGGDANAEEEGFREARLALHLSASLSPTWSFFAEAELSVFDDDTRETIERGFFKYTYSDRIQFAFGRFHTPLGWWNSNYHHGRWLQTTIDRPLLWEFGSVLQPAHFQGVQFEGGTELGSFRMDYTVGAGAGRAESVFSPLYEVPLDGDVSGFFNLRLRPQSRPLLNFGLSYWFEELEVPGTDGVDERMWSLYLATRSEQPELMAEVTRIEHDLGGALGDLSHDAYYLQIGYRLDGLEGKLKPYGRIEEVDLDGRDPIYAGLEGGARRGLVGLRYDVHPKVALKLEWRRDDPEFGDSFNALQTQIALVF